MTAPKSDFSDHMLAEVMETLKSGFPADMSPQEQMVHLYAMSIKLLSQQLAFAMVKAPAESREDVLKAAFTQVTVYTRIFQQHVQEKLDGKTIR